MTGMRTFCLRIDSVTARVLERARQAHSMKNGDTPRERAVDRFCIVIDVCVGCEARPHLH